MDLLQSALDSFVRWANGKRARENTEYEINCNSFEALPTELTRNTGKTGLNY